MNKRELSIQDNNNKNDDGTDITEEWQRKNDRTVIATKFKIDFSVKREVFFIIRSTCRSHYICYSSNLVCSEQGSLYYLIWIVFGHIASVYVHLIFLLLLKYD